LKENRVAQSPIREEAIIEALRDGSFEEVYKIISGIRGEERVSQSQARKILEEIRKIKDKNNKEELKNGIIKTLMFIEYQSKRRVLPENVKKYYNAILETALKVCNENPENLGKNLYDLIEMLTIKFYERS